MVILTAATIAVAVILLEIAWDLKRLLRVRQEPVPGFSAMYPVFTKEQIDTCQRELQEQELEYKQIWDAIQERDDFKVFSINPELKNLMRDCSLARVQLEHLRKLSELQIEGNAAVFSGKKAVAEVRSSFDKLFWEDTVGRGFKECNQWIQRLSATDEGGGAATAVE